MNFLLRSTHQAAAAEQVLSVEESLVDINYVSRPTTTMEGIIVEDPFPQYSIPEECNGEIHGVGSENGSSVGPTSKNDFVAADNHLDVLEENGWIIIPKNELPDDWNNALDICSLRSLDRSFVFAGEQVHIVACLSAYKQDTEIITPFKVAAMMSKNGSGQSSEKQNIEVKNKGNLVSGERRLSPDGQVIDENCENPPKRKTDQPKDTSASEYILRMEDQRRQTEMLLQRFKDSHFFVRIAESGELLWSKKDASKGTLESRGISGQRSVGNEINAVIDTGKFDANICGGVARNTIKCYSLSSGDIVVLLQVNIGVNYLREPIIEILQFEKFLDTNMSSENQENLVKPHHDPYRDLLKWLLPLDNTLSPPARSLSPPPLSSSTGIGGTSQKSTFSASSGSQLFSFGHFRSYSTSSLPQNTPPSAAPVKAQHSKPSFDLEDWDHYLSQKFPKNQRTGSEGLLSFRGVLLEQERFSVRCGLEGIYIPGRRWWRKIEIIQPLEIHSFAADCNADDLICVQIKNISPACAPDIVVYIDAISIVYEEAATGGPPSSLPIACIEAGNEHSLPNLALRKGEEHSFILKPASCMWKTLKVHGDKGSQLKNLHLPSSTVEGRRIASSDDRYEIMVSCRCNYTESRLFFKQPTSWRPRISRDIMISVASEMSGESSGSSGRVSQLPVQVLTLQASNLTLEDLNLTVLAPASFTSPPTVGSLSSSPSSPLSPFINVSELPERVTGERHVTAMQRLNYAPPAKESERQAGDNDVRSASFAEQSTLVSDVMNSGLGCTHLWLQSRIPLGTVPSKSTATIKLELLPLTDGIITLDTLQIEVKEKGRTYIPERSLKINATSSISTGIL